ncbi:MAG: helix-turn-helix transcriptional regulator [Bacteroidales bacterium]|jgi:DNA-binding transcriptional ArsR family regulator|nr:helix-turn-helix transcriptional regulator [Bacteroidales bacterium]
MADKPSFSESQLEIAQIAKALSHPARVFIMERLLNSNFCSGKSCCTSGEMINDIPIARSTLSQHLKELKLAGLIQGEIELPTIKYCVNTENWERAKQILENFIKQ